MLLHNSEWVITKFEERNAGKFTRKIKNSVPFEGSEEEEERCIKIQFFIQIQSYSAILQFFHNTRIESLTFAAS